MAFVFCRSLVSNIFWPYFRATGCKLSNFMKQNPLEGLLGLFFRTFFCVDQGRGVLRLILQNYVAIGELN
jgi:hypothetical protein